jgi:hypothetical protein
VEFKRLAAIAIPGRLANGADADQSYGLFLPPAAAARLILFRSQFGAILIAVEI